MRSNLLLTALLLSLVCILGCQPSRSLSNGNFAYLYAGISKTPFLQVVPFSQNEMTTHIYARWRYSDLKYHKDEQNKARLAHAAYSLHFEVYPIYRPTILLDSGTFILADSLHEGSSQMCDFEFNVKAPQGQTNMLHLGLADRNSHTSFVLTFPIKKDEQGSSSFFRAGQEGSGMLYTPVITAKETVVMTFANPAIKRLYGSYFCDQFPLPAPSFIMDERRSFKFEPDSTFVLLLEKGNSAPLRLNRQGIYFFSIDTTYREGFTLFRYSLGFPELITARQMLMPLRYITSGKEFEKLSKSPDIRNAIDSFWIATAGNADRALRLIHDYYSRVERANELFSTNAEGWQTDRGLIYIVYGAPTIVYRHDFQEEWIYGESRNLRSLHFYFMKAVTPFSTSDFVLSRDPTLKQTWYMAVERWRR